ncbi:MAG: glycosyltransferase family 2 protein [Kiritimatiellia bacterium]
MKFSIITPSFNSLRFFPETLRSIRAQRRDVELEHIVIDGGSTDGTVEWLREQKDIDRLVVEPDRGPADALNKGLALATGDVLAWLNADDVYHDGALARARAALEARPHRALAFGRCRIVDEEGGEIRKPITRFKELFFPVSCRFAIQCINYVSQPAVFFRREAFHQAGPLRIDLKAAFDYDLTLRLWRRGGAVRIPGPAVSDFRWHPGSISGQTFENQFKEELEAAFTDAGRWSPQAILHRCVRHGIVGCYRLLNARSAGDRDNGEPTKQR